MKSSTAASAPSLVAPRSAGHGPSLSALIGGAVDACASVAYRGLVGHTPDLLLQRLGVATPRRRVEFYTLERILRSMHEVQGAILECGTHHGATLLGMAHVLGSRGIRARIFGLDSFEGFPEPTSEDALDDGTLHPLVYKGALNEASVEKLTARLRSMGLAKDVTVIKGFFDDTLPTLAAERFSLAHLDCDLYDSYMSCLEFVYPRMLADGYIVFDDYSSNAYLGARRAVDEFFADKRERIQFFPEADGRRYFVRMGGGIAAGAWVDAAEPWTPEQFRAA